MKIAFFYQHSLFAGSSTGRSCLQALRQLGHDPIGIQIPAAYSVPKIDYDRIIAGVPKIETLREMDAVIHSGIEYSIPWMDHFYPDQQWRRLPCPQAAWAHESNVRDDRIVGYDQLKHLADFWFYPCARDADLLGGTWLPWACDPMLFCPAGDVPKYYDAGSIGLMYQKRADYLKALIPKFNGVDFRAGQVAVQNLSGYDQDLSTELYIREIRRIRVFVTLPSLVHCMVGKTYEVMACGTYCLSAVPTGDPRNMCVDSANWYSSQEELVEKVKWALNNPEERQELALIGMRDVISNHTFAHRFRTILSTMFGKNS